jgi:hypothetical protein
MRHQKKKNGRREQIKFFGAQRFFRVGRETANKAIFNLGPAYKVFGSQN